MKEPATTTYALLGLLAIKPWTGYELTQQVRRSLRYAWPSSEAHLYREQKLLVRLGWASVRTEKTGGRTRKRYRITPQGRRAFRAWLETPPELPRLEIESVVRVFFADQGSPQALADSMRTTADQIREAIAPMAEMVDGYLDDGGPFPDRLHLIALTADLVTDLLDRIRAFADQTAEEAASWEGTAGVGITEATRERLERIRERTRPG